MKMYMFCRKNQIQTVFFIAIQKVLNVVWKKKNAHVFYLKNRRIPTIGIQKVSECDKWSMKEKDFWQIFP